MMKLKTGLKSGVVVISAALLISACSTAQIAKSAYPDRTKHTFTDPDDDTKYDYLCEKKATEAETAKQAADAHKYVIKSTKEIAANALSGMFEKAGNEEKKPSFLSLVGASMSASMKINRDAGKMAKEVEKKFQCLLIEVKD